MPLYEYYCPPCGTQFEVLRSISKLDDPATCPEGHVTNNRVLSLFAAFTKTAAGEMVPMTSSADACACGGACACGAD